MVLNLRYLLLLNIFIFLSCIGKTSSSSDHIKILTEPSSTYSPTNTNAVYPIYVDSTDYQSWNATKGEQNFFQFEANGGAAPYTWEIMDGELPTGLVLSKDGKLSGKASQEGTYRFTVKVTDAQGDWNKKDLELDAHPYRSKWMTDAKFGIMIQWGTFTYPKLFTKSDVQAFEKRINKFDAERWVSEIKKMGASVLNFSVKGGDGFRLWPSKVPSKYQLNTNRNIVKELIDACHRNNIKFVAYFAPDHGWNNAQWDVHANETDRDKGTGKLNTALIKELVDMGVDGLWVDMSAMPELYPESVNSNWFDWNDVFKTVRVGNPAVIVGANPGINFGGVITQEAVDVVIYEGEMGRSGNTLAIARPSAERKLRAIEVDNLLDSEWGVVAAGFKENPKSTAIITQNIEKNWQNGATYVLNYPVFSDGDVVPKGYRKSLQDIGNWVKSNKGKYDRPANQNMQQAQMARLASSSAKSDAYAVQTQIGYRKNFVTTGNDAKFYGVKFRAGSNDLRLKHLHFPKGTNLKGELIILRHADGQRLLRRPISINDQNLATATDVTFLAGNTYIIAVTSQKGSRVAEMDINDYWSSEINSVGVVTLSSSGKMYPALPSSKSYAFNLGVEVDKATSTNHAANSELLLENNRGGSLEASRGIHFASNAVDGDPSTIAQASGEYAWSFLINLRKPTSVRRISLTFSPFLYATDFEVQYTANGTSWQTLKHITNNSQTAFTWDLNQPVDARAIKIKANAPNDADQPGIQMAIAEVGIY